MRFLVRGCGQMASLSRLAHRPYHELSFASTGPLAEVLEYGRADNDDETPPPNTVRVAMLHAPLNPADALTILGKYPPGKQDRESRYFPGRNVAGSEGIGMVADVPEGCAELTVGDVVTVAVPGLGTLRSSLWVEPHCVLRIPRGKELIDKAGPSAATLSQLGSTAYRMLMDFVPLQPGSIVLQNAGNSGVGIMVSQLTKRMNVLCVSVVRRGNKDKDEWNSLVKFLQDTAKADLVLADEDLSDPDQFGRCQEEVRQLSEDPPLLALNTVGGESASNLLNLLGNGGTMVTYGGISGKPVTTTTADMVAKDLRLVGHWHSRWMSKYSIPDKSEMVNELVEAVLNDELQCPASKVFDLADYLDALAFDTNQSGQRSKLVFRCSTNNE